MSTEPTFLSAVIPLTAQHDTEGSDFLGRAVHAWFLRLIQAAAPARAEALHTDQVTKPFTVSGLVSAERPGLVQPEVHAGAGYWVRITALEGDLVRLLLDEILPALPATVQLGPATFDVGAAITDSTQHPWARLTSAQDLADCWFGRGQATRSFNLRFASPTATRRIRRNLVIPEPVAVFAGYLRAWNRYGQPPFDRDLLGLIEGDVWITSYQLRTSAARLREKGHELGYVGWCGYNVFRRERAAWQVVNLLADFSQFCGTGIKTTQGMGQTRREAHRGRAKG